MTSGPARALSRRARGFELVPVFEEQGLDGLESRSRWRPNHNGRRPSAGENRSEMAAQRHQAGARRSRAFVAFRRTTLQGGESSGRLCTPWWMVRAGNGTPEAHGGESAPTAAPGSGAGP